MEKYVSQIKKGYLEIISSPTRETYTSGFVPSHAGRMSESHCFAPLDVQKPFIIRAKMKPVGELSGASCVGFIFNYRDAANFYCIAINKRGIRFSRIEEGRIVGFEENPTIPKKINNTMLSWELKKDGDYLTFSIEDTEFMKIRYAPIEYRGFGFFAYNGVSLSVDEVEFIQ